MIRNPQNNYRDLLQDTRYTFQIKVDTPWQDLPDLAGLNKATYDKICYVLKGFRNHSPANPAPSEGIVLLGEAGTGKTHLLMRVAKNLAKSNFVLFVPKPNNEEAVYLHTWSNIVQSLAEFVPARSTTRSQLDDLLAHVFSKVLVPGFQKGGPQEQGWAKRLEADPLHLFEMLGKGDVREKNFRKIRGLTLGFLKAQHPTINETITHALITYVLAAEDRTRRVILTWLAGQGGIDETEAKALGLPIQWVEVTDQSAQTNYLQQREDQALAAIKTLGILSTYYQPLILAYDQLEGLRTRETLARRWSEAVREILNYAPNYLVLTCVFPSLWETWTAASWVETSSAQRIGSRTYRLDPFSPAHAVKLLEGQTEPIATKLNLPSATYPFEAADIQGICAKVKTPREFLLKAREDFENWLFQDDIENEVGKLPEPGTSKGDGLSPALSPPPGAPTVAVVLSREMDRLGKYAQQEFARRVPNEEDLFGRVRHIIEVVLHDFSPRYRTAKLDKRVMPFNIVVLPSGGPGLCLSILNSTGTSFTARLRNLKEVAQDGNAFGQAIILRDQRVGAPTRGTVGEGILQQLEQAGNVYLEADAEELIRLHTIYAAIVAIEQEDLQAEGRLVTLADLVSYLRSSGYLQTCELFKKAAQKSPLFHALIYGEPTEGSPKDD